MSLFIRIKIIGRGYNRRTTDKNPLAHAELLAIKRASKSGRLAPGETVPLYVTLEPCQMCSGAMYQARIKRSGGRLYEPKSRMCRFDFESVGDERV